MSLQSICGGTGLLSVLSGDAKDGFHLSRGVLYLVPHLTMGIYTIVHNSVGLM